MASVSEKLLNEKLLLIQDHLNGILGRLDKAESDLAEIKQYLAKQPTTPTRRTTKKAA